MFKAALAKWLPAAGRNQHRIEVEGEEFFADLLFFQRDLKTLVVIELKKGKFKPAYLGQLNFYLSALDKAMTEESGEKNELADWKLIYGEVITLHGNSCRERKND